MTILADVPRRSLGLRLTQIGALLLCLFIPPAGAATFWSWSADSATTSLGTCKFVDAAIDSTQKNEGTGSMRITVNSTQGHSGCSGVFGDFFNAWSGTWRYYRWWMKIDSNFNWGTDSKKLKASRVFTGTQPVPWTGYVTGNTIYIGECPHCEPGPNDPSNARVSIDLDPVGGCSGTNSSVPYDCTQWTEYIVGMKLQSCENCFDGEFHVWANGGQVGSGVTGMNFFNGQSNVQEAWLSFMALPYSQVCPNPPDGCTAGGTIWVDDFSVDDTWNSKVGARPLPPKLLPAK